MQKYVKAENKLLSYVRVSKNVGLYLCLMNLAEDSVRKEAAVSYSHRPQAFYCALLCGPCDLVCIIYRAGVRGTIPAQE